MQNTYKTYFFQDYYSLGLGVDKILTSLIVYSLVNFIFTYPFKRSTLINNFYLNMMLGLATPFFFRYEFLTRYKLNSKTNIQNVLARKGLCVIV